MAYVYKHTLMDEMHIIKKLIDFDYMQSHVRKVRYV